jgi:hypothetical protein
VVDLKELPYEIPWGSEVFASIIAMNDYGPSEASEPGNGAVIITYPDIPTDLAEDYSQRTATTVTVTWLEGAANGGSTVIDYRLTYDAASGTSFVILENNILDTQFLVPDLTPGLVYKFKI